MFTNTRIVRVEWGDCDPAGIVFYPRYFAFFDASTQHLFEAAGFPKPFLREKYDIVGYPMVDTRAKFIIPSKFGEDIKIVSSVAKWGRSSFDIEHKVYKGETLAIEAFETRVWAGKDPTNPERIKSKAIPEEVIARFNRT
jgi:4-hydroxybenzoyl-CoA thioesterase